MRYTQAHPDESVRVYGRGKHKVEFHDNRHIEGFPVTSFPEYNPDEFNDIFPLIPKKPCEFREFCSQKHREYDTLLNRLGEILKEKFNGYDGDLGIFDDVTHSGKHVTSSLNLIKEKSEVKYRVRNEDRLNVASAIENSVWFLNKMKEELEYVDYFLLYDYFHRCV